MRERLDALLTRYEAVDITQLEPLGTLATAAIAGHAPR